MMAPSTPTRAKGSAAALTRGLGMLSLDASSPLSNVSTNVRSPARMNPMMKGTMPPAVSRREKEDRLPVQSMDMPDARGVVVTKDWDGPDGGVNSALMTRRRSATMVSRLSLIHI